jgi:hypothetical protein
MKSRKQTSDRRQNSSNVLRQVLHGQVVSSDFFARHWMIMAVVMFLILIYIAGKYTCQTKMEEVRRLDRELEIVRAERVRVKSDYMSRVRESSMQQLVDTFHLGLSVAENPPYIIE